MLSATILPTRSTLLAREPTTTKLATGATTTGTNTTTGTLATRTGAATEIVRSTATAVNATTGVVTTAASAAAKVATGATAGAVEPRPMAPTSVAAGSCPAGKVLHRQRGKTNTQCVSVNSARSSCPFPSVPLLKGPDGVYVCAESRTIPNKIAAWTGASWRVAVLQRAPQLRAGLSGADADYREIAPSTSKPPDAAEVDPNDFSQTVAPAAPSDALMVPDGQPQKQERPWLKPAIIGGGLFVAGVTAFLILRR